MRVKFGFDGRIHQINYIQTNAPAGIFTFDEHGSDGCPIGSTDFASCGGDAMASFMMGNMANDDNGNSYYEIQFRPATTNSEYGAGSCAITAAVAADSTGQGSPHRG